MGLIDWMLLAVVICWAIQSICELLLDSKLALQSCSGRMAVVVSLVGVGMSPSGWLLLDRDGKLPSQSCSILVAAIGSEV